MDLANNVFLHKCFSNAVLEVVGTMACIEGFGVEPGNCDHARKGEITGVMIVNGTRNVMLTLNLSFNSARGLVSSMTGMSPQDLGNDDIYDGVAELINMIAGRAKALLVGTEFHYNITPPFTVVGQDHIIIFKKRVAQLNINFSAEDMDMKFGVAYL